jgi:hypothetical protein
LRPGTHPRELLLRHNEEVFGRRLGQKDEIFCGTPAPSRRDCDPIFVVDGMEELAGVEGLVL